MAARARRIIGSLAVTAGLFLGGVAAATPSSADLSSGCSNSNYYWCETLSGSNGGNVAHIDVYRSNGHDYIDADIYTTHSGENLWVLTWNGTGWNWQGFTSYTNPNIPGEWIGSDDGVFDGNGTLIKIAIWDYGLGHYIYSDAH
jgi:hypothetical protein